MSKPARRKDTDRLKAQLENVADAMAANRSTFERVQDTLADHGIVLSRLERGLSQWPPGVEDLERLATLTDGVKVALERMGGNSLPSFRADILALRDQMGEFRREMADYRATLMSLSNWLETVSKPPPDPPVVAVRRTRKSRKNAQQSQPQMEISCLDAAPHNGADEEQDVKP